MRMTEAPRLLLFDIDGTLIRSGGRGKKAIVRAMKEYFGVDVISEFRDFAGSTDLLILRTLIDRHQIPLKNFDDDAAAVMKLYFQYLKEEIRGPQDIEVMPGIYKLLEHIQLRPQLSLGLLTGNVVEGAQMKLDPVKLYRPFPVGAFGSDSMNRNELPPLAVARAEKHYRRNYRPENVWVIGDTPRDIECGKVNGFRTLAVATGGWTISQLQVHQPDVVLADLSDTGVILQLFLE